MESIIYDLSAGAWVDRKTGKLIERFKCVVCGSRSEDWVVLYCGASRCVCSDKCLESYQNNIEKYEIIGNVPVRRTEQISSFG